MDAPPDRRSKEGCGVTTDSSSTNTTTDRRVGFFVAGVAVAAGFVTVAVTWTELNADHSAVNWWSVAIFAALLIVAETRPNFALRFGNSGMITPGWAFAFALLLVGTPVVAVATCAGATLVADKVGKRSMVKTVFNVAQVSLALGLGALVLEAAGLGGAALGSGEVSFLQSLGLFASGCVVLLTSAMLLFGVLAISQNTSIRVPMREGWSTTVTADGALLALAPVFVIAVQYGLLLLPMLAATSFIVFTSARQAIRQAHAASHDPLTGLRNRLAFRDAIDQRLDADRRPSGDTDDSERQRTALLLIDLDGFKEVNDRLGHATGDALLVAFADHMDRVVPSSAVTARLGGDEFAILIEGGASIEADRAAVIELHAALSQTLNVDGFPLKIEMSIGVACAPEHGVEAEALMACADIAMYRAKRFDTQVELYGSAGAAKEHGRIGLLGALSSAIDDHELTLCYQPQVRMNDGSCGAVEALLRWKHPTLGAVPPGEFIAVAEQTELIGPITDFVLCSAIADIVALNAPDVAIAVNISARNLQDRHFSSRVLTMLDDAGLSPDRLELEITESSFMSDRERSRITLDELREAGVRLAVDDFGTGYSSFTSLRELDVDRLKIDRSFIAGVTTNRTDQILVRSIVSMATELGLETVAEGIEDLATWDVVRSFGCVVGQGFLVSHPLTFRELSGWFGRRRLLADLSEFEVRTLTSSVAGQ